MLSMWSLLMSNKFHKHFHCNSKTEKKSAFDLLSMASWREVLLRVFLLEGLAAEIVGLWQVWLGDSPVCAPEHVLSSAACPARQVNVIFCVSTGKPELCSAGLLLL